MPPLLSRFNECSSLMSIDKAMAINARAEVGNKSMMIDCGIKGFEESRG